MLTPPTPAAVFKKINPVYSEESEKILNPTSKAHFKHHSKKHDTTRGREGPNGGIGKR